MNIENTSGEAEWKNGEWIVVFRRPLAVDDPGSVRFQAGRKDARGLRRMGKGAAKSPQGESPSARRGWAEVKVEP